MRQLILERNWDKVYRTTDIEELPWFSAKLDPDIDMALTELGISKGTILDIGSGPGTQAIALARRGFEVTGLDISESAIEKAAARAGDSGVAVEFRRGDILKVRLEEKYNVIIDRGCFHIIDPAKRKAYARKVHGLLKLRGYLLLKTFSHREPPGPGPFRLSPYDIRSNFEKTFRILTMRDTAFRGPGGHSPKALFCVLQRLNLK